MARPSRSVRSKPKETAVYAREACGFLEILQIDSIGNVGISPVNWHGRTMSCERERERGERPQLRAEERQEPVVGSLRELACAEPTKVQFQRTGKKLANNLQSGTA